MGRAHIGCHGTKRRLQLNVSSMRRTGRQARKIGDPDPTLRSHPLSTLRCSKAAGHMCSHTSEGSPQRSAHIEQREQGLAAGSRSAGFDATQVALRHARAQRKFELADAAQFSRAGKGGAHGLDARRCAPPPAASSKTRAARSTLKMACIAALGLPTRTVTRAGAGSSSVTRSLPSRAVGSQWGHHPASRSLVPFDRVVELVPGCL
jgi:hypothetical protein